MSKPSKVLYFFISLLFFVISDLYFSNQILQFGYKLPENPVFDVVFIKNEGAAFNILQNSKTFLIIFSLIALICIIVSVLKNVSRISVFAIMCASLLCAGVFCNLYERIAFGHVRDFLRLNFIDFPVFNISDIFINLSVFAIVIIIIKSSYLKKS